MKQQLLDLSTAHIQYSTSIWIDLNGGNNFISYPKGEYGWFIYVQSEEQPNDMPNDLVKVINYTKSIGCDWLMLDRDGEIINELETFDW